MPACQLPIWFSFLLIVGLASAGHTQNLRGRIVDASTNEPLAFANVYYNNTTIGVQSDIEGKFSIKSMGLQVELVVSYLGYETLIFPITESYADKILVFKLVPKVNEMKAFEVNSKRGKAWYENLEVFKELAIGTTFFASDCTILNPEVLQFAYDTATFTMRASADEPLQIEHKAFGYKITYELRQYEYNVVNHNFIITGYPFFTFMTGNKQQERRWKNNQLLAYEGSLLHFGHAVRQRKLQEDGFELHWVERMPNPNFRETSQTKSALNALKKIPFYQAVRKNNPYQEALYASEVQRFIERVDTNKVDYPDFVVEKDSSLFLHFKNYLQVKYSKSTYSWAPGQYGPRTSLIFLDKPSIELDATGRILEPAAVRVEGFWASQLLGDLLPLDYQPPPKKE
ncbi:carboxypeptidase-like regulatory domain-containing protein [Haliscomenobacter sp.]|uniref:carboxypeptidase-like regulatory domain-containing protein n=1 Tax=Haliscomenobacter sp. TaxID=2717303 RepID=UPI003BAAC7EE